jgi:hypothetical protein
MTPKHDMEGLMERLAKRAKEDRDCEANNLIVADALSGQMDAFDRRDGTHSVYAVRMAVDHRQSAKRDAQYAADLEAAIALLSALTQEKS